MFMHTVMYLFGTLELRIEVGSGTELGAEMD
jgi:hypothetical protein